MNAIRGHEAKYINDRDVPEKKTRVDYSNHNHDLHVVALKKPPSFAKDRKKPGWPALNPSAVETGIRTVGEKAPRSDRNGLALKKTQFQSSCQKAGTDKRAGTMVPNAKRQGNLLTAPTAEKLNEGQLAVSHPLGTHEMSGMETRRIIRRVRRQRSETKLEAFSEIAGDDLTVESSMACLYSETEDVVVEEIDYGYGTKNRVAPIPPVVQLEQRTQNQAQPGVKPRKSGRRQSIGTVSISVNIAPPLDTTQVSRRSRRASISTITVNVNFDQGSGSSHTVNARQSGTIHPTTNLTTSEGIKDANSAVSSIVLASTNDEKLEESNDQAPEIEESDSEGDYSCSESGDDDDEGGTSPEEVIADATGALVANISVQLTSDDNSISTDSDDDNGNGISPDDCQFERSGVDCSIKPMNSILQSATQDTPNCTAMVPVSAMPHSQHEVSRNTSSFPSQRSFGNDIVTSLSDMSRNRLVDHVRANRPTDGQVFKSSTRARTAFIESTARTVDPLGDSNHSFKAEATEKVEAYETAVSMQNIGIHNRYGFMIDDKEVKRSSSRKRHSLSFNRTPSDSQGPSLVQMRNVCEPMTKRNSSSASKLFPLSNHGSARSAGLTGSSRYGPRPPMQKSMSTRSFSKPSLLYRRASSRSINQSKTIAENAEMVDQTPYVQEADVESSPTPQEEPISNMTIMYRRRSSKSMFHDEDDDLSVSDMGSVMSFGRDEESVTGISVGAGSVMSGRSKGSKRSAGVSAKLSRKSTGFRVGKLIKKISLRRKGSEESSQQTAKSTRSNFLYKMLAKRGRSKRELEPWRALDTSSPCYWADHHVDPTSTSFKPKTPAPVPQTEDRRIKRRASM